MFGTLGPWGILVATKQVLGIRTPSLATAVEIHLPLLELCAKMVLIKVKNYFYCLKGLKMLHSGRQFWGCDKPMGQGCNFFKWAEDADSVPNNPNPPPPRPQPQLQATGNQGGDGDVLCRCGSAAVLKTVRKDGPNQGQS